MVEVRQDLYAALPRRQDYPEKVFAGIGCLWTDMLRLSKFLAVMIA
jgi:hypothetical protein